MATPTVDLPTQYEYFTGWIRQITHRELRELANTARSCRMCRVPYQRLTMRACVGEMPYRIHDKCYVCRGCLIKHFWRKNCCPWCEKVMFVAVERDEGDDGEEVEGETVTVMGEGNVCTT